jgi:hypothetical protein
MSLRLFLARYVSILGLLGLSTGLILIVAGLYVGTIMWLTHRMELGSVAAFLMAIGVAQAVVSVFALKAIMRVVQS